MKNVVFAILVLFNLELISADKLTKLMNQEESSLVIIATNQEEEIRCVKFNLNTLKKSNFPEGPHRYNPVELSDFNMVLNQDVVESISKEESFFNLSVFCIEHPNSEGKKKACGFELPSKGKLSYVFCLDEQLKDIKALIVQSKKFDDLTEIDEIDDATKDVDTTKPAKPIDTKPTPKCIIKIKEFGTYILLKLVSLSEKYSSFMDYFRKKQNG